MLCSTCGMEIGRPELPPEYRQAFQVRVGYVEDDEKTFQPEEDVGYYCSECLSRMEYNDN